MDRITRVRIKNVRAIESLELDVTRPLTVLIGENGSGKSTIIECLELLRRAADTSFLKYFYTLHRGHTGLLRKGATELTLGVRIEDDASLSDPLHYEFTVRAAGAGAAVSEELLKSAADGFRILAYSNNDVSYYDAQTNSKRQSAVPLDGLALASFGSAAPDPRIQRTLEALRGIEVHLAFDTRASWAARSYQRPETIRAHTTHFPAERLSLMGVNLANAWAELLAQPSQERERTLSILRLGLGDRIDTVVVKPDMGGGNVYLAVRFTDMAEPVFAADLSDGQLSWLAFVALAQLNRGRSLLAVDEPELHLHPHLLAGVITLLKRLDAPVLVATHADRVLELLDDPAESVRVCSLDEHGCVAVSRIDGTLLPEWLAQYGDLGRLRAAGYLPRVLLTAPGATAEGAE